MNSREVADWLNDLSKTTATPVSLKIEGCRNPGAYTQEGIFALGILPKCYKRRKKVCFIVDGDSREWYIAGYYQGQGIQHGPNFILHPWTIQEKIDLYERKPYDRKEMIVTKKAL